MQPNRGALALFLTAGLGYAPTELVHAPEQGTALVRTITDEVLFEVDHLEVLFDGEDLGAVLGEFFMEGTGTQTVVVRDAFSEVADGRVTRLSRTFETIEGDGTFELLAAGTTESESETSSSVLEGTTVVFAWDEDLDDYTKTFEGDDAPDELLLEDLEIDMDMRSLLPGGPVEEGDTWERDLSELYTVLMPGGDLALLSDDMDADEQMFAGLMDDFDERLTQATKDMLEGTVVCTYEETREIGGARIAIVSVDVDLTIAGDLSSLVDELVRAVLEDEAEIDIDFSIDLMDFEGTLIGEGELQWNVADNHIHAFSLATEFDGALDFEVIVLPVPSRPALSHSVEGSLAFQGTSSQTIAIE